MKRIITHSENETIEFAKKLMEKIITQQNPERLLIFLEGELGAGKTTLVKGIAKALKIKDTIISPTFVFIREYNSQMPLYHFDLYRIEELTQLDEIGFFEYIDKNGIIVIEWAEKLENTIKPDLTVLINKINNTEREIIIK